MFFGPLSNAANRGLPDLTVRETIALAPSLVLIFVIGLFPSIFLNQSGPSVGAIIEQYRDGRRAYQDMPEESEQAVLLPRRGGPLERGYPEAPTTMPTEDRAVAHAIVANPNAAGVQ
jgi:hypothetical protein